MFDATKNGVPEAVASTAPTKTPDLVSVAADLGQAWANMFVVALDKDPDSLSYIILSAWVVTERVRDEIRRRLAGYDPMRRPTG